MKIGILGTGKIAHILANTMIRMKEVELYAIASRELSKAEAFQKEFNVTKACGSYEELVSDDAVELVYIAVPHSHHFECMKLCFEHNKNVLCEKAFTINADQAREAIALAKEHNVYLAEAIWPRYMPSRNMINDIIASGIIGKISMATCNLSYDIDHNKRLVDISLAGGALLDVGVYGLNFLVMHLGKEIEKIESSVQMTDTGVDGRESITVFYKDGTLAVATHGIYGQGDRNGVFYGEKGYIVVENINNPRGISVYDIDDRLINHYDVPEQISGYEYEFLEAIDCINSGKKESTSMPLDETIYMMELMDGIRGTWGLKYPQEN